MHQTKIQPMQTWRRTLTVIRHAQSSQNKAKRDIMAKHQLAEQEKYRLEELPEYQTMLYSPLYMDAPLSQLGLQQAQQTRQKLKDEHFDLVLVSPFRRALQTCDIVFRDRKDIRVVVEPLLAECICSACDIGSLVQESVQIYGGRFDFGRLEKGREKYWYLDLIKNQRIKQQIQQQCKKTQNMHQAALNVLRDRQQLENVEDLRNRCKLIKEKLKAYLINEKQKVAIVSHYFLLMHLTCKSYSSEYYPVQGIQLWNAQFADWTLQH